MVTYAELQRKDTVQVEFSQKQGEGELGEESTESTVVARTVTVTGGDPGFGAERTEVEADEASKKKKIPSITFFFSPQSKQHNGRSSKKHLLFFFFFCN